VAAHHRVRGVADGPHDQVGVELLPGRQHGVTVACGDQLGVEVYACPPRCCARRTTAAGCS
jgi:hypothetical protein